MFPTAYKSNENMLVCGKIFTFVTSSCFTMNWCPLPQLLPVPLVPWMLDSLDIY